MTLKPRYTLQGNSNACVLCDGVFFATARNRECAVAMVDVLNAEDARTPNTPPRAEDVYGCPECASAHGFREHGSIPVRSKFLTFDPYGEPTEAGRQYPVQTMAGGQFNRSSYECESCGISFARPGIVGSTE